MITFLLLHILLNNNSKKLFWVAELCLPAALKFFGLDSKELYWEDKMKGKRNLRYARTKMFIYYLTYKASILVHTSKACIDAVVTVRSRRSHNGGT